MVGANRRSAGDRFEGTTAVQEDASFLCHAAPLSDKRAVSCRSVPVRCAFKKTTTRLCYAAMQKPWRGASRMIMYSALYSDMSTAICYAVARK